MPRHTGPARDSVAGGRWLFLAVAVPLFAAYVRTLAPTVPFEDGGEMISPSFTLGIHHPPGYPLYALAGRLWALLPLGDVAFRYNLLSAACGAAACGLAACAALVPLTGIPGVGPGIAWGSSLAGGWLLGTTIQLWWQSVIAEKYSMNLAFAAALLLLLVRGLAELRAGARKPGGGRWLPMIAAVWGIAASHHGQVVYFAPAAAWVAWLALARIAPYRRVRAVVLLAVLALLGMSLKMMYPPIRSAAGPLFNWDVPNTAERLADYAAGGPYQYRILYWTPRQAAVRLVRHASDFPARQFGWPGVALGLLGLGWLAAVRRREAAALALIAGTGVLYCVNFVLEGIAVQTYYLPVFMIVAVWIAAGIAAASAWLARRSGAAPVAAAFLLAGWAGYQGWCHGRDAGRGRHYFAWDFSSSLLRSCDARSLLIAYGDYDLFPLWYTHYVAERRPDVVLINSNFVPEKGRAANAPGPKKVQLLWPRGQEALAKRFGWLRDLEGRDPGRPVFFSVVYEAVEGFDLLPRGAAYRWCRRKGEIDSADVEAEYRWWRGWRTIRGFLEPDRVPRDSNTRTGISYYAYGDYRRGYVLDRQGRSDAAIAMYRKALAWPDFWGIGPAAAHASIARLLYTSRHDVAGAIREYEAAVEWNGAWLPARRSLGALLAAEGRFPEALAQFEKVAEIAPSDPQAAADVRRLRAMAAGSR